MFFPDSAQPTHESWPLQLLLPFLAGSPKAGLCRTLTPVTSLSLPGTWLPPSVVRTDPRLWHLRPSPSHVPPAPSHHSERPCDLGTGSGHLSCLLGWGSPRWVDTPKSCPNLTGGSHGPVTIVPVKARGPKAKSTFYFVFNEHKSIIFSPKEAEVHLYLHP